MINFKRFGGLVEAETKRGLGCLEGETHIFDRSLEHFCFWHRQ
jgi:hypothetical protein